MAKVQFEDVKSQVTFEDVKPSVSFEDVPQVTFEDIKPTEENFLQSYIKYAQPAFKMHIRHPLEMMTGTPMPLEEFERVSKASWGELLEETYPRAVSQTTGGQVLGKGVGGAILDIGTRPSSYIGAGALERLVPFATTRAVGIPAFRGFAQKHLPTFLRGALERTALVQEHPFTTIANRQLEAEAERQGLISGPGRYAGSILEKKFPKDVAGVIEETAELRAPEIAAQRRGVVTFAEQRAAAEKLKATINLDTLQPGDILNAETRRAAGLKIIDHAKSALAGKFPKEKVMDEIVKLNGLHSEAGRLLGSLRDPLFNTERESILALAGEVATTQGQKEAINKLIKNIANPSFWDKLIEFKTSVVLTSPHTIERATTGNLIRRIFKVPERFVGGLWETTRAKITGRQPQAYPLEAVADVYGTVKAMPQAMKRAWQALIHEEFITQSRAAEAFTRKGFAIGKGGKLARLGLRGVTAVDEFCHTLSKQSSLYAQAYKQAATEGLKGTALISRTADLVKEPSLGMIARATEEALDETARIALGKTGKAASKFLNVQNNPVKLIQLFLRTPINLWKAAFQRSPLGFLSPKNWTDIVKGTPRVQAQAVGRVAVGQMLNAWIATEAWQGNISGSISPNRRERDAIQRATGKRPYSMKIGDKWVSYAPFQPLGMQMAITANLVEEWQRTGDDATMVKRIGRFTGETVKAAKGLSFLMGVRDMINVFEDPERQGERFISNLVTGFIPNLIRYSARLTDQYLRDPEGLFEQVKSSIPILRKGVPERLDVYGRPIPMEGTVLQRALTPTIISKEKDDLIEKELVRLGKFAGYPSKKIGDIELTREEYRRLLKTSGDYIRHYLGAFMTRPGWPEVPDEIKIRIVERVISDVRQMTRTKIKVEKGIFLQR